MQLKQLKLAGFKSFVEPTIIPFPSQLVAVVGPNGCGKSNIIDAVRWVMGESSAKNLRGESMTDVIFNGSSNRKSVGQASVELIFDNSFGRLTGQYASYQEIAVKRVVNRDGESSYYLNGGRCRRRDINDVFLGTGAGVRGYAIIGQDMISRLIEARPDDLRAYLEEAAGVSKYKERRRETVMRISHTRENLERVADIRTEIDKQLTRLERQAKAAERYKLLKEEERLYKAEILALKWQVLTQEQTTIRDELRELSLQYEQYQTNISHLLKEEIILREQVQSADDAFQQTQAQFYQLGTEIARLEEFMQQQVREKQRLATDQQQIQADWQIAVNQTQQDQNDLVISEQLVSEWHVSIERLHTELANQHVLVQEKQQQEVSWNIQWQETQTLLHEAQREKDVEQVRQQHLEQRRQQTLLRLEKIQQEQVLIQIEALQVELATIQGEQQALSQQHRLAVESHQQVATHRIHLRQQLTESEQALHQAQDQEKALATEQAVLLAAQNAALNAAQDSIVLESWRNNPRLVELITVDEKWFIAAELVLGDSLQAIVLDSLNELLPALPELQDNSVEFVTTVKPQLQANSRPCLLDKITGVIPNTSLDLTTIFAAESLDEALSWLPSLDSNQSIITIDGYWLGQGWVRVARITQQNEASLLLRQQALVQVNIQLGAAQDHLQACKLAREQLYALLTEVTQQEDELKQTASLKQTNLHACESMIQTKQHALNHALSRIDVLAEEGEELQILIETLALEQAQIESNLQIANKNQAKYEDQQRRLIEEKALWEHALGQYRHKESEIRVEIHQFELQHDREKLRSQQLRENIKREQLRIETLQQRLDSLVTRYQELEIPDIEQRLSLEQKIEHYQQLEMALTTQRQRVEELQTQRSSIEQTYKREEQQAKTIQEKNQQQQMQEQALAIKAQGLVDLLKELDASPHELLAGMSIETTLIKREQDLVDVAEKIKRLGAINLVAIEEYETERQRKQHLDEQYEDLMAALATLDTAIAKMDKETQLRLQDTFDQINSSFQLLFPRLFGGGRAMLELTCDNLLEAGILVMAQPPGKRNSTIHMLSGGEKAMTAVALVFAIFQLNPSPFCMLDEVDAPLDDANVRRFCDLVKEMSEIVQFLFITHNKVTMELADHLIGVTMREPGVSRVVTVDVEEALSIAE